jgi:HSP20 family protein
MFRSEIRHGAFTRRLPLPAGVGEKDVEATYKAGVLEVRVPVDIKQAAATKIPIRTGRTRVTDPASAHAGRAGPAHGAAVT